MNTPWTRPLLLGACVAAALVPPGCGDGATTVTTADKADATGESTSQDVTTSPTMEPPTTGTSTTGTSTTELPTTGASPETTIDTAASTADTTDSATTTDTTTIDASTTSTTDTTTADPTNDGAVCGDSIVSGSEECDDGLANADWNFCTSTCKHQICGDGLVLQAIPFEGCDEGGVETPTCNADCTVPVCGDYIVNLNAGEECDNGQDAFCDGDCTFPKCGDGLTNFRAGEGCDDGNMVDDDGCSNQCSYDGILVGGSLYGNIMVSLDAMGVTHVDQNAFWLAPNGAPVIILGHYAFFEDIPDYGPHFAAGNHLLIFGGTVDSLELYQEFVAGHFATDNASWWEDTSDCDPDWTRGPAHPITALLPDTHEFIVQQLNTAHVLHFSDADQPPGVTVLGSTCHNAPDNHIMVTRKYPGGGTFTFVGLTISQFLEPDDQAQFLVPLLTGYLDWIDQGAP